MNEILTFALSVLVLLAGLAALVLYVRRDVFSGPFAGPRSDTAARDSDLLLTLR